MASNGYVSPAVSRKNTPGTASAAGHRATLSGKTGILAEELAKTLNPLEREDECGLPLLGLLQTLATGKVTVAVARRASKLYSRLRRQYCFLSREHEELAELIEQLKRVAPEEGHLTAVRFAETLERRTQHREELLYPAALLAGRMASSRTAEGKNSYAGIG